MASPVPDRCEGARLVQWYCTESEQVEEARAYGAEVLPGLLEIRHQQWVLVWRAVLGRTPTVEPHEWIVSHWLQEYGPSARLERASELSIGVGEIEVMQDCRSADEIESAIVEPKPFPVHDGEGDPFRQSLLEGVGFGVLDCDR